MTLICPLVRRDLSRYADAELSCRRAARVERHLADCPACQRELDAIVELARFVAGQERPEPPRDAWDRLDVALDARAASARAPFAYVAPRSRSSRPRVVAWAAVVLIAAGLAFAAPTIYRYLGPRPALAHNVNVSALWTDLQNASLDLNGEFAGTYMLRVVSPEEARRACPVGKGAASEVPSGFTLTRVMLFETDCCSGMAAEYRRGENWLTVVQIPNDHEMDWGDLEHEERQVGLTWCEVHEENDLCSLVHHGRNVNLLVVGDSEAHFLGEVATFLAGRTEGLEGASTPGNR